MNRALLVGINKYPGAPLSGCVNDVVDMANFLVDRCGFVKKDVRLVTDGRATTKAVLSRLSWLIRGAKAGDRLFFHYSGHGAQVATRNADEEVDGLDEVICPVDFDWSDEHMIRDKQFREIFAAVPKDVEFVWVSDSCHSGDLSRELVAPDARSRKPKSLQPPADIQWRNGAARDAKVQVRALARTAAELNVALISGCRSDQTSSDAWFNDRPNGALTHYLLQALESSQGLKEPLTDLVVTIRSTLRRGGYDQEPQLEGSPAIRSVAFLHQKAK